MTVANPDRSRWLDAARAEYETRYRPGPGRLKCAGCKAVRPSVDFREMPWHGRSESCKRCEGGYRWDLRIMAKSRYIRALRIRLLLASGPTSADALTTLERPYHDALTRAVAWQTWAAVPIRYATGTENHDWH